jgi:tRNA threonylcarbamoyladenosine biosynthesis protein TsaB
MVFILNIETATKNCSVSISKDGETVLCKEIAELGYSHAEKLHVFIEELLVETNLKYTDLNAIAVSQGPGSYTGLRIGISAAKGLCYALDIPLIALDTLAILAAQVHIEEGLIIPMIDARRMEVYSAVFDAHHQKVIETQAEIITEDSFKDYKEHLYIIGDSTEKCKTVLTDSNFIFKDEIIFPSSKEMSFLSFEKYNKKDFVNVAYFEPLYLKDFIATTPKKQL